MTTTDMTITQIRDQLIAEARADHARHQHSERNEFDDWQVVLVSAEMWDDYYCKDVEIDHYLLMKPETHDDICTVYIPTRLSAYSSGCRTSIHMQFVSLVADDLSLTPVLPEITDCDHSGDWHHHYDSDSVLGDYYTCARCGELTQVG